MSGERETTSLLDLARQVWRLLDATQKRQCVGVLLLSIAAACLTLVGIAGIGPFFAALADPTMIERNSMLTRLKEALGVDTTQGFLVALGAGFVTLLVLANAANFVALLSIGRFAQGVGARLHSLLFGEYLHRGAAFHASSNSAVLATRVVHDVGRTVGGVVQSGLTLFSGLVSVVLIALAIIVVDPVVAVAALVSLGASYVVVYALMRRRLLRNGTITTNHWKARAQVIDESFAAIKDVIVHRAQPQLIARVAQHSEAIARAQASTPAIAAAPRYVLECMTAAGLVTAALWVYGRAGPGTWLTHLAFLAFAAYRLLPAVQQVFAAVAYIHAERPGFDGIAADLRLAHRRALDSRAADAPTTEWRGRPRHALRLIDVSYRHSAARDGGVFGVSLEIPAGTLAGFVGPNGAGKTTLAELVLGLLSPDSGRIEVDDVALDEGNRSAWFGTVAYVPQRIALLDGTLAQNIAFGASAADVDIKRAFDAARSAQLAPLIEALPDGLATVIGENGARLSGGQRQRVGLARALYRRASLLVVDEGTNALDTLTETEVLSLLGALRGKCTIIVIGHRPSALAGCDVMFELDAGRLVGWKTVADVAAGVHARGSVRG